MDDPRSGQPVMQALHGVQLQSGRQPGGAGGGAGGGPVGQGAVADGPNQKDTFREPAAGTAAAAANRSLLAMMGRPGAAQGRRAGST